jgi:5-formyltetrahydrofolate cyclo-ligase
MTKSEIRQRIWQTMEREGVARFPGAVGRVPNFAGAHHAAQLLREMAVWRRALVVKVNPDAPQLPVRRLALAEGKILYMAVPRLRTEKCFVEIDPQRLGKRATLAASINGACRYGRAVSPREMRPVDLVVCGSVAVGRDGARIGKGGGYCDLEYGLLREEGKVRESTPILTTVHALQIAADRIAMLPHDLPVDFLVTPGEVIATRPAHPRPRGIYWDLLRPLKINAIPLLRKRLKRGGTQTPSSPRRL